MSSFMKRISRKFASIRFEKSTQYVKISALRNCFVVRLTNLFLASTPIPKRDRILLLLRNKFGIVWLVDVAASEKIFAHIVLYENIICKQEKLNH